MSHTEIIRDEDLLILLANNQELFAHFMGVNMDREILEVIRPDLKPMAELIFSIPTVYGHYSVVDVLLEHDPRYKLLYDINRDGPLWGPDSSKMVRIMREREGGSVLMEKAKIHFWLTDRIGMALVKVNLDIRNALDESDNIDLSYLMEKRQALLTRTSQSQWVEWDQVYDESSNSPAYETYKIGLPEVDKLFSGGKGFRTGNILTIAAQAGCGKTSAAHQLLIENAKQGTRALYFSLENSGDEIAKMFSDYYIGKGMKPEEQRDLNLALVDDKSDINDIVAIVKDHKQRHPDLKIVLADYCQLIQNREIKGASLYQRMESASNAFTELKKLGILIVMLAQIDKDSLKSVAGKKAKLTHNSIKGGVWGESSSYCIVMQPEELEEGVKDGKTKKIFFNIAKNRHGMAGCEKISFHGKSRTFKEL